MSGQLRSLAGAKMMERTSQEHIVRVRLGEQRRGRGAELLFSRVLLQALQVLDGDP